jgi:uracil-DNA glycosylase family 4
MPYPRIDKSKIAGQRVPGDGPLPARIMIVGERPGVTEPGAGRPFVGAAGKELDRYLSLSKLRREECYVTNVVKDYQDFDPTDAEIARDAAELEQEILDCSPELIIPVGRFAIRYFLGDVDVEQVHGLVHFTADYGAVYPCFHPAAGLHSPDFIQFITWDFIGLRDPASRFLPHDQWPNPLYPANHPPSYYADLAVDTEGLPGSPWCLTATNICGEAMLVMANDRERIRWYKDWFTNTQTSYGGASPHYMYLHNSMHDLGILREMGIEVPDERFIDTMVLAYHIGLEPQGLKALAYRLAGMTMHSYDEVIASGREHVWREWMEMAAAVADQMPLPEDQLVWEPKINNWRVKRPYTIEQRIRRMFNDVDKKGILLPDNPSGVDIANRVNNWDDSAADALVAAIGRVPEPTLSDIPKDRAERYACRDADATLRIASTLVERVKNQGSWDVAMIDHSVIPMVERMQSNGILRDRNHFEVLESKLTEQMEAVRDRIEALVGVRINPSSPDQVSDLLFKHLKLTSRKSTSSGESSTNDKVLMALRNEHPVIPEIMEYRGLNKARGSFVRVAIRDAGPDGRLRTTLRVTRVSSGRISSSDPNLMAFPVRDALGKEIRQGFIAPPGKVLADWDLDQAEMRFMTHESEDNGLIDVFRSGIIDVHTDTASRMFGIPYANVDKNKHRYPAKRVGFGVITGITGAGLVDQMALAGVLSPDGDEYTESECDNFIELWFKARPGVRRYMDRCRAEARRQGWVADKYGRIRHLPGVWSTLERIREEACRQSHSHKIQAGAQGYMKKAMAMIWWWMKNVWWPRGGRWAEVEPLLQIHDSLLFELPDDREIIEEVDNTVVMCLSQADELLVPMGAKGGTAHNWGDLK